MRFCNSSARKSAVRYILLTYPLMASFHRLAGSTILRISFGIDVKSGDDPYITLAEKGTHSMAAVANAGAYLGMRSLTLWSAPANISQSTIFLSVSAYWWRSSEDY